MHIKRLIVTRYRGFESFMWDPHPGVNCLIGPGDSGKSTILSAVCLLLTPYPTQQASEFDYHRRQVAAGFSIEAFIGGLDLSSLAVSGTVPPVSGWLDGKPVPLPDENGAEAVLHCSVRGTADLEIVHEILVPEQTPEPFGVGLRKRLLLARLAGEERSSKDLRLGSGTLLNQFLEPLGIRSALHAAAISAATNLKLPTDLANNLEALSLRFSKEGLPQDLHLGLFPQQGSTATGMLALFTGSTPEQAIPLAYSGTGTKQLAVLSLSTADLGHSPIITVDEPERGLEPYRQRTLITRIIKGVASSGQAFLATHSPAILSCLQVTAIWRTRPTGAPALLDSVLSGLLKSDPEAFFAPQPVICEGATEVGLLRALLSGVFACDLDARGIRLVDGCGQPQVFKVIRAFHASGLRCAAFLDNEAAHSGMRDEMRSKCDLFVWKDVVNIEHALASSFPLADFPELLMVITDGDTRLARAYEDQMRAYLPKSSWASRPTLQDIVTAHGEAAIRNAFCEALNKHKWLKHESTGYAVGSALLKWGLPTVIHTAIQTFGRQLAIIDDPPRADATSTAF